MNTVTHPRRVGLAPDGRLARFLNIIDSMRRAATRGATRGELERGAIAEHIPPGIFREEMRRFTFDRHSAGMPWGCLIPGGLLATTAFTARIDGVGVFDLTHGAPCPERSDWGWAFLLAMDGAPVLDLYPGVMA